MSTRIVHRPARLHRTIPEEKPLAVAQVPMIRARSGGSVMTLVMPLVAGTGMVLMMMSSGNPIRMVIGGIMFVAVLIGAVGMFIRQRTGSRRQAEEERTRFLEHLTELEEEVREVAGQQQVEALTRHPHPRSLIDVTRDPYRLWERRKGDEDFLVTRIGTGVGKLARGIEVPASSNPMQVPEPIAQAHLDRMMRRTSTIDGLPIAIPARGVVSLVGDPKLTAEAVRAMLAQAAVFHAPDDLRFHLALPTADHSDGWAVWFPHLLSPDQFDGPIGKRNVSYDESSAAELLSELDERAAELKERSRYQLTELDRPHLLVVVNMDSPHGRFISDSASTIRSLHAARVSVIATSTVQHLEPTHVDVRVLLGKDRSFHVQLLDRGEIREPAEGEKGYAERVLYGGDRGTLDEVTPAITESIARSVSPLRLVEDAAPNSTLERTIALDDMLGIGNFATYDIAQAWAARPERDFLNVPFGIGADGEPVELDIKESAKSGMGPHGLCVGATGSGKSEVLRTLVLAQVICHPPDQLSLVLVDFKGGATFAGLEPLPHTAAIVDNLEDAAGLVDRLHDSILGEIQRRQRVLQQAGNLANVSEYNALRAEGKVEDPLPVLFVVIDEFGELLAAKPEFIDLFVQIGRIGRSIGVHLLLASQRLEEGRLRGLESYLSYRIGLRTFSAQESRAAIGTTDAHELPPIPGSGFLKVDPDIFDRFKAAYVSGPYEAIERAHELELPPVPMPLHLANTTEDWLRDRQAAHSNVVEQRNAARNATDERTQTTLELVVSRLTPAAEKTRQIWLPPLPATLPLESAVGPVALSSKRGLSAAQQGQMVFPIGLKDKPLDQWQGPLALDLSGSGGNLAIMGAPQSGKTTALRSLVTAAALTHTPREVNFYLIDMSGSGLSYLEELPHVGTVATRFDENKVRRTVAEMSMFLAEREQLFSANHISNVQELRSLHKSGLLSNLSAPDIVLAIDGWSTLRKDHEDLAEQVGDIAQRGLAYGIHVIFLTGRWADFRLPLQAVIGTRLELRLNDPIDSAVGKKVSEGLKDLPTGRVATADGLYSQIAVPHLERVPGVVSETSAQETVAAISRSWTAPGAPQVRMLPESVTLTEIRRRFKSVPPVRLGLTETTLGPATLDCEKDDRLVLLAGEQQSGKTSALETYIKEVTLGRQQGDLMIGVWDLRRGLLDVVPQEFLGGFAATREGCETLAKGIAAELTRRLPAKDITVEQLRDRSWWTGPEIYCVIDNYETLEGSANPLKHLVPFLGQAADLGLHIITARRSAGYARASYDSFLQAMRESGNTTILLSGERQEGAVAPGIFFKRLPPGRAQRVTNSGTAEMLQIALPRATEDIASSRI